MKNSTKSSLAFNDLTPHTVTLMGFLYLYYALGLPSFLSVVIALYLLFTGTSQFPPILKTKLPPCHSHCLVRLVVAAQAPEKRSMLVSSSKSQVCTCGR
jgi:hypothetical protein